MKAAPTKSSPKPLRLHVETVRDLSARPPVAAPVSVIPPMNTEWSFCTSTNHNETPRPLRKGDVR